METKKVKALSWKRGTNARINPSAPHRYQFAARGGIWFEVYTMAAGTACPAETVVKIHNPKDQPVEQRLIVADERVGHETCNEYLRTFLAKQAVESAPKENVQRVLAEMIAAMEPTIVEAIKRERIRKLSCAKEFLAAKKDEPKLTLQQWSRDHLGIARDAEIGYGMRSDRRARKQLSETQGQARRYLTCPAKSYHLSLATYEGAWQLSDRAIAQLENDLNTTYRAMLIGRLRSAWLSYVPKTVESLVELEVKSSPKGFIASATLKLEGGKSLLFNTKCIGAGGYNIKRFHYRYITHVKEVAEKKPAPAEKPARKVAVGKKPLELVIARDSEGKIVEVKMPEFATTRIPNKGESEKDFLIRVRRWAYTTRRVHVHGWRSKKSRLSKRVGGVQYN